MGQVPYRKNHLHFCKRYLEEHNKASNLVHLMIIITMIIIYLLGAK